MPLLCHSPVSPWLVTNFDVQEKESIWRLSVGVTEVRQNCFILWNATSHTTSHHRPGIRHVASISETAVLSVCLAAQTLCLVYVPSFTKIYPLQQFTYHAFRLSLRIQVSGGSFLNFLKRGGYLLHCSLTLYWLLMLYLISLVLLYFSSKAQH